MKLKEQRWRCQGESDDKGGHGSGIELMTGGESVLVVVIKVVLEVSGDDGMTAVVIKVVLVVATKKQDESAVDGEIATPIQVDKNRSGRARALCLGFLVLF